ncbi:MAG TPA: acetate--CoA ligase family protein [Bordetella sp.]
MRPRSIAIVGVSERPGAAGTRVWNNLRKLGFPGPVYPVNPKYETFDGAACYPGLAALPETVDVVFLAVPAAAGPDLVEEAGRLGIGAAFLNANGYADGDEHGKALQRRIVDSARRHGMALSGPNNLGLVNIHARTAMWTPMHMRMNKPGPVGLISQSGSVAMALAEDERELGFAYLVTTGNEAGATVADYLDVMVRDDNVQVILLFLETVRDPALLASAAREAARRGKRILALKLGTSEGGRALVQAHTGSLAGEDRLYDAFFKHLGIVRVRDLDEMLETASLFVSSCAAPPACGTAIMTLSGGEAALLADIGHDVGLAYPPLSPETLAKMRPAFPPHSTVANPVDGWGLGFNEENFRIILRALMEDPGLGTLGFVVDAPGHGGCDTHFALIMGRVCAEVLAKTASGKRLVFINNIAGTGVNAEVRAVLDPAGIAYLSGMPTALKAIRNLVDAPVARPEARAGEPLAVLPGDEPGRFQALRHAGVPMTPSERVDDAASAADAAQRLGYPVVLKGVADHLPHKSDLGLVRLGLRDAAAVGQAYAALRAILDEQALPGASGEIVVQKMAGSGVELIVGVRNDPRFGSFVIAGPGGVLVEISKQAGMRLGPISAEEARAMLRETAAGRLLDGVRGQGPWDIDAAAEAIAAFSRFGHAHRDTLAALEINPLIVQEHGAVGVDLLLEPHTPAEENSI